MLKRNWNKGFVGQTCTQQMALLSLRTKNRNMRMVFIQCAFCFECAPVLFLCLGFHSTQRKKLLLLAVRWCSLALVMPACWLFCCPVRVPQSRRKLNAVPVCIIEAMENMELTVRLRFFWFVVLRCADSVSRFAGAARKCYLIESLGVDAMLVCKTLFTAIEF